MSADILVVAEHLRGELSEVTRQAVTAAAQLTGAGGNNVVVALIGGGSAPGSDAVALEGVDAVVRVPVEQDEFNADVYLGVLEALVRERDPTAVLMGFTTNGMAVGPALAARADLGFASDVISCSFQDEQLIARRPFYGGKVEADVEFDRRTAVLLLRPNTWPEAASGGTPEAVQFDAQIDPSRVRMRHLEFLLPPSDDLDISKAEIILAIGRGIGERENIPRLEALAEKMGITLAASRPLVDAGWVVKARQVGQSGATVKPKLYVALGISGAVQHLTGMKSSERIIAVNHDPRAPIFSVAEYGAVEDLFDVVEELEKRWG